MNVKEIVIEHLKSIGADGLISDPDFYVSEDGQCSCSIENLMDCDGYCVGQCKPAKKVKCKVCNKEFYVEWNTNETKFICAECSIDN